MDTTGVIHGRFQVLHNDHMKYILAGKARCEHLVVGITNPDPTLTRNDSTNPERSDPSANPLTYFERYVTLREALVDAGVDYREFSIVPFPINLPDLYQHYVPLDAVFYLTIYDKWGRRKLDLLRSLGLKAEVMWEKPPQEKGICAAEVRRLMVRGKPWEHLVPRSTARLMILWGIPERLRGIEERTPTDSRAKA
ncbi:MAG: nicotinate-nucleotide adenylyltransferase [Desulfomonile tiedjei]|nr:nicotinate-nucleotide adenylyltransferase [Desulfomonile tiedjei]